MKKFLALFLSLIFVFSFAACGKQETKKTTNARKEMFIENGVEIEKDVFKKDTVLKVAVIDSKNSKTATIKKAIPAAATSFKAYEITAESEGVSVQPDGKVEVVFPIPDDYDKSKHAIEIYYVADDGSTEFISSKITKDGIKVTLTHFSAYVVVVLPKEVATGGNTADTTSTPTTSSKPSTSSTPTTSSNPTTSSKPNNSQPTKPIPVPKGAFSGYYITGDSCYTTTLTFSDNKIELAFGIGDDFDKFYEEGEFEEPKETIFEYEKDSIKKYGNKYYRFGRGGGDEITTTTLTNEKFVGTGIDGQYTVTYTYNGTDTITITGVTGKIEGIGKNMVLKRK